jgi:hypothetical protein
LPGRHIYRARRIVAAFSAEHERHQPGDGSIPPDIAPSVAAVRGNARRYLQRQLARSGRSASGSAELTHRRPQI